MSASSQIPNDDNGQVLLNMISHGDDLTQPRMIDFCHIFPGRRQALAFAEIVDDRELKVCISYYEEKEMWEATVKRYMIQGTGTLLNLNCRLRFTRSQ